MNLRKRTISEALHDKHDTQSATRDKYTKNTTCARSRRTNPGIDESTASARVSSKASIIACREGIRFA